MPNLAGGEDPREGAAATSVAAAEEQHTGSETMRLMSSSFESGQEIPSEFTCEGKDRSPALSWTDVPPEAKSLALIVDDPDAPDPRAPRMTWVHWVLYNIPAQTTGLAAGVSAADLPAGTLQGKNDWRKTGYGGPCPPIGKHRYFHKLYALDTALPDLREPNKDGLLRAMSGHVLATSELVGTYVKKH
ncbi:MAG: YbhB/YbcL family Raf kinase inhibitor-like protein [Candidatus Schekmanbacteria bacterium]|nr:YbhB/YbcL family Raf kinase inhibitor-like protein [Candidatus Schekmanbacteria bacterium]